jgi:hypothetical protein
MNMTDSHNLLVERLSVIVAEIVEHQFDICFGIAVHGVADQDQ